jgi:hypothetical protein
MQDMCLLTVMDAPNILLQSVDFDSELLTNNIRLTAMRLGPRCAVESMDISSNALQFFLRRSILSAVVQF